MKTISVILLSIVSITIGLSQAPSVIPPSPNAFAFQKYGDIPVSSYTGIPNVSIPIYEVKSGGISVPITLSYHAGGIKVADEASQVGLGWVMNAGGLISRTIVGADDFNGYGFLAPYHNSSVPELEGYSGTCPSVPYTVVWGCAINLCGTVVDYLDYDSEPDQYYYNLPGGQSGKFILKRDKTVVLEKDELIDIQVFDSGGRWTIRTSDGFMYEFNVVESQINTAPPQNTAWYLSKITTPANTSVNFKYLIDPYTNVQTMGTVTQERTDGQIAGVGCSGIPFYDNHGAARQYKSVTLDSIVFNEGAVKFSYSTREDLAGDHKLDTIVVFKKAIDGPAQYKRLKSTLFSYGYFEGGADQISGSPSSYESKRLKLKQIDDRSKSNKRVSAYRFEYNADEITNTNTLPSKLSYARDHWGYYNAQDANQSLVPTFTPLTLNLDPILTMLGRMGYERDPHPTAVGLFSLKKIWYPTGGYTEFEMESNDFDLPHSNENENSPYIVPETNSSSTNFSYSGNVHVAFPANYAEAVTANKVVDLSQMHGNQVRLNAYFRFTSSRPTCPNGNETVTFELVSETGGIVATTNIFQALNFADPNAQCSGNPNGNPAYYDGITYTNTYSIPPGKYFWRLYIDPLITYFADVHPTFTFNALIGNTKTIGGGQRVKRILTYEVPGASPQLTRYEYGYSADVNTDGTPEHYSYGRRMVRPNYSYFTVEFTCEYLKRSSDSSIPLSRNGAAVGYDQVNVYYGENGENGKTTYVYNNESDYMPRFEQLSLPRKPPVNASIPDPLNGTLKAQYDFVYRGANQFDTVRTLLNTYQDYYTWNNVGLVWACEKRDTPDAGGDQCTNYQRIIYAAIRRNRVQLISSIEKTNDATDPTRRVTSTTTNTYSATHFQPIRQDRVVDGRRISNFSKYVLDFPDAQCTPAMLAMKTKKYSPVIQSRTEQQVGAVQNVLAQSISTYGYFNGTSMILPESQANLMLAAPLLGTNVTDFVPTAGIDTTKYKVGYKLTYDTKGNIQQVKIPYEGAISYIWNYLGQPIAEVKNASAANCAYSSFEYGINDGNWAFSFPPASGISKTGNKFFPLTSTAFITKQLSAGKYFLDYYSKSPIVISTVTGLTVTDVGSSPADANGWIHYKKELTATASLQLKLTASSGTIYLDEVRLYPKTAQMTTYVHEPLTGMISSSDVNGRTVYYEYDDSNRLKLIRDDSGNILKTIGYRLKDEQQ